MERYDSAIGNGVVGGSADSGSSSGGGGSAPGGKRSGGDILGMLAGASLLLTFVAVMVGTIIYMVISSS